MKKIQFKNKPNTDTPINDDNLNLLQENIEEALVKQSIFLGMNEQTGYSSATPVAFNKVKNRNGEQLILENNFIKIGTGILKIRIDVYLSVGAYEAKQVPLLRLYKNDEQIAQTGISCIEAWSTENLILVGVIVDVVEGDLIKAYITGNSNSVIVRSISTMTVEQVA